MPDRTKNDVIINCLAAHGYRDISVRILPKLFRFTDGQQHFELEVARPFFLKTTVETFRTLMNDEVLPAIKTYVGKKVYLGAHGIFPMPHPKRSSDQAITTKVSRSR